MRLWKEGPALLGSMGVRATSGLQSSRQGRGYHGKLTACESRESTCPIWRLQEMKCSPGEERLLPLVSFELAHRDPSRAWCKHPNCGMSFGLFLPSEGASRGQAVGPWRQRGQSEQAAMRVRMWAGSQARSGCASQETGRTGPGVAPCCRGQDAGVGVEPRRGGGSAGSQRRRRGCSPAPSRPSPVPSPNHWTAREFPVQLLLSGSISGGCEILH